MYRVWQAFLEGMADSCGAGTGLRRAAHALCALVLALAAIVAAGPALAQGTITSITVSSSSNPSLVGQTVTFTAALAVTCTGPDCSHTTHDGNVQFFDGATSISGLITPDFNAGTYPNLTATVSFPTSALALGAHTITARYLPGLVTGATSTPLTQTVNAPGSTVSTQPSSLLPTVQAIGRFLGERNNQLLTNEPDGQRQIDRLVEAGGGTGGTGFATGSGPGASASGLGLGQGASRLGNGPDATDIGRLRSGGGSDGARPIGDAIAANAAGSGLGNCGSGAAGFGASQGGPIAGIAALFGRDGAGQGGFGDPCASGGGGSFGGAMGGMRFGGTLEGAPRLGFSTSLRDMTGVAAAEDAAKMAAAGLSLSGAGSARPARANPFDIWVEAKFAGFSNNRANADLDGHVGLVSIGADYVLNRSLLVGTMVQFDSMQQRSNRQQTDVRGHGWMAGPYATLRLSQNVFWQVRGTWGGSSNHVSPFLTYVDSFDTKRWQASSTLSGRWQSGAWSFRPSASISYMEDASQSYADTFGTLIPSVKSTLGQAKAGPEVSYRIDLGHTVIEPHAGVQVIYNFAQETTAAGFGQIGGEATGPSGARGRAEVGVRAMISGGIGLDVSGSYDGIGTGNYSAVTGKAMVRVPLN